MRLGFRSWRVAVALAYWLAAGTASAGSLVEFPNLPVRAPPSLRGYLARPDSGLSAIVGETPADEPTSFPAVVVLHGCSGVTSHSMAIADRLSEWGYVALTVDSFATRRMDNHCGSTFTDQAFDAYAALYYLTQVPKVDQARIAVLGQSMGGFSALYALDRGLAAQYFDRHFRAAVAYYPTCGIPATSVMAPILILIGEADDWTPAEPCRDMVAHAPVGGPPISLAVYPGAYHAFDVPRLRNGIRYHFHWLEYNDDAAKDAERQVREFLAKHLGGAVP